ncbi:hypothetical protein QCA50_005952 [Cerrena zonata]|uniref:F-box domain-containing protein n=1 Tax=Cerrena zonata TaxID=2478898 RepID=A0AAW0GNS3_9APHY
MPSCKDYRQALQIQIEELLKIVEAVQQRHVEELDQLPEEQKQELDAVRRPLAELRQRLNAMQPIGSLPPEILVVIFECCLLSHDQKRYPYDWVPEILHVCSQWRVVALNAASLWIYINPARSTFAFHALQRSKNYPLTVVEKISIPAFTLPGRLYRPLITELFEKHSHRIQRLDLNLPAGSPYPAVEGIVYPLVLGALSDVTLHYSSCRRPEHPPCQRDMWLMRLPSLKYLDMSGAWLFPASVMADFSFPRTLEVLKLQFQTDALTPTIDTLISSLQHCSGIGSRLTKLVLRYVCKGKGKLPPNNPVYVLHFPRLVKLSLTDDSPACTRILRHIATPPNLRLKLVADFQFGESYPGRGEITALISALLDKQTFNGVSPTSRLTIYGHTDIFSNMYNYYLIILFSDHCSWTSFTITNSSRLCLLELLKRYCASPSISEVRTLCIRFKDMPSEIMSSLQPYNSLLTMPAVSLLEVEDWVSFDNLPSLLQPYVMDYNDEEEISPLPKLTHIDIVDNFEQSNSVYETCRQLGPIFQARSQISFQPLSIRLAQIWRIPKPKLDALVKAFTMGIGILQGPIWVQFETDNVFKQFAYDDWEEATSNLRGFKETEIVWLRFFIAYRPTIDSVLPEEDLEHTEL